MFIMLKKLIRKIIDRLFLRKFDDIKIQKGQLFERFLEKNLKKINNLNETYFKVFSQDYEDGIIQFFLKSLNVENVKFIEIGTQDYSESNTRYIFETMRCEGLLIDPTPNLEQKINSFLRIWKNKIIIHNDYVDAENIVELLSKYSFDKNLDLFSLDIDGIDYWILKSLPPKLSKILVTEYNPFFGDKYEISAPNIKKFDRFQYHHTGFCWGASLKAIIKLMREKGYIFVGTNRLNVNAFFINEDYINKIKLNIPNINFLEKYTDAKFNIFKKGKKKTHSFSEIKNNLNDLFVYDINSKKLIKFDDLK